MKIKTISMLLATTLLLTACTSNPKKDSEPKQEANAVSSSLDIANAPRDYQQALETAEMYVGVNHSSKYRVFISLTQSTNPRTRFSKKAANFAIKNVEVDWYQNALARAKYYRNKKHFSDERLKLQLTSKYGEGFTKKQAEYAIKKVNQLNAK